jgi:hypothetical protein
MINAVAAMRAFLLDSEFGDLTKHIYGTPPGLPAGLGNPPPAAVVIWQMGVSSDPDMPVDTHRLNFRVYASDGMKASELYQQMHNLALYPGGLPANNRLIRGRWFLFNIEATSDNNVVRIEEGSNWPVASGTYLCKFNALRGA